MLLCLLNVWFYLRDWTGWRPLIGCVLHVIYQGIFTPLSSEGSISPALSKGANAVRIRLVWNSRYRLAIGYLDGANLAMPSAFVWNSKFIKRLVPTTLSLSEIFRSDHWIVRDFIFNSKLAHISVGRIILRKLWHVTEHPAVPK